MTDHGQPKTSPGGSLTPLSPLAGATAVGRFELRRALRGRSIKAAAAVALLLVVAATLGCIFGEGDSRATFVSTVRRLFPWLTMALSLLFAARTVSDDLEAGVLPYFFSLPLPRWSVTLGKYMAAAGVVGGVMVLATVLLYVGTHLAEPSLFLVHHLDLWRALAATLGASLTYSALFLFLGAAVADLPYLLPLLYVAVFEVGLGSLPVAEVFSLRHHVNILLGRPAETAADGMVDQVLEFLGLVTPTVTPEIAALVLASACVSFLFFALLVTELSEYRRGKP